MRLDLNQRLSHYEQGVLTFELRTPKELPGGNHRVELHARSRAGGVMGFPMVQLLEATSRRPHMVLPLAKSRTRVGG